MSAWNGLRVIDTRSGAVIQSIALQSAYAGQISPDGTRAAVVQGSAVQIWNLETGTRVADGLGHTGFVYDIAFDPSGRQLASVSWDGTVRIWPVP